MRKEGVGLLIVAEREFHCSDRCWGRRVHEVVKKGAGRNGGVAIRGRRFGRRRQFGRREDRSMVFNETDGRGVRGRELEVGKLGRTEGDMVKTNVSIKTVP